MQIKRRPRKRKLLPPKKKRLSLPMMKPKRRLPRLMLTKMNSTRKHRLQSSNLSRSRIRARLKPRLIKKSPN